MGEKGIDPDILKQFAKIVLTIFIWFWWLFLNMVLGIVLDLGFFDNPRIPLWLHILFFIWYIGGFIAMIWVTKKKIWHR
jgi:hypothetical protein